MPSPSKLLGQKFNRLSVIAKTQQREHGNIVWKCLCDCGNIAFVNSENLIAGNTKSCGCWRRENAVTNGKKAYKGFGVRHYNRYVSGAIRRGLEWSLSLEHFNKLQGQPCYYCGKTGERSGIDRVDNSKGYIDGNVVPCCSTCNFEKKNVGLNIARKMIEFMKGFS